MLTKITLSSITHIRFPFFFGNMYEETNMTCTGGARGGEVKKGYGTLPYNVISINTN